ncbi:MAG: hypothetical protein ACQETH_10285 [Candidatus Rifleibacteriota bacterium]
MENTSGSTSGKSQPKKQSFPRSLCFFILLVLLPLMALYVALDHLQQGLEKEQKESALEEMAEITAHLTRLATPKTFFENRLRRLANDFRWAEEVNDVVFKGYKEATDLYLFNSEGKRIPWQGGTIGKRRISEKFLKILITLNKNPLESISNLDQTIAASFSGNSATIYSLSKTPGSLLNFQGLGLRKFGSWFKLILPNNKTGYLLAFVDPENISKHHLAERAIRKIQNFAGDTFRFAWLDVNNPIYNSCTRNLKVSNEGEELLSLNGLKSRFSFENQLIALNDTEEGIRLVCFRNIPRPPEILEKYFSLLGILIPVFILFFIWKTVFNVRLDLSVGIQFSLIFGYTALTGILILLAGIAAFQNKKQASIIAEKKQEAIKILEKTDRDFIASYGDLLRQYRHLSHLLSLRDSKPEKILKPLQRGHKEGSIAFAGFTDQNGNYVFRAPRHTRESQITALEGKYSNLINSVSLQIIQTFNSTRQAGKTQQQDVIGVSNISARPVESLLYNRSTLQNITFDGDETITFMDLAINASDTAKGCLFIIHEPQKLQISYLNSAGNKINRATGFTLAAFPKSAAIKSHFFPRYSMSRELPLWKLQDLVNQTQVSSFKIGRINKKEVLVAATPGSNLRNYNLFLIMPLGAIKNEANQLTILFIAATILAIIFIAVLSGMLVRSLITPISNLAQCAGALSGSAQQQKLVVPEGNELESISTGLADLIIKVREFNEGRSIKKHLLPPVALKNGNLICDGFQISKSADEKEIYHFSNMDKENSLVFFMRTNQTGIEGSLNLSMARMAIRLISEELNVNTSYNILKTLEEYFRINLRRQLGGDFFLGIFNHAEEKLNYAGCGEITAFLIDSENIKLHKLEFEADSLGSSDFYSQSSNEIYFGKGMKALILSPILSANCNEKLKEIVPSLARKNISEAKSTLQSEAENHCRGDFVDSASLIIVHLQKEDQKT